MIVALLFLIIALAFTAGLIVLQIFLSKRDKVMPGLILPIISFTFALLVTFGVSAYTANVTNGTSIISASDSEVYYEYSEDAENTSVSIVGGADGPTQVSVINATGSVLVVFLIFNIPTALYLLLFFCLHTFPGKREQSELDKMTIQDL